MIPVWWSFLLTAVGILGLWLAGSRRRIGWAIGVAAQVLWISYAVATSQWGFILSAVAYGTVYARNMLKWRRETSDESAANRPAGAAADGAETELPSTDIRRERTGA